MPDKLLPNSGLGSLGQSHKTVLLGDLGSTQIREKHVRIFAQVSGDRNPYHLNPEYAAKSRYQGQIGHGVLTLSMALTQFGRRFPGFIPTEVEVTRFTAPVRLNDYIQAVLLSTTELADGWKLRFTVENQDQTPILEGNVDIRPRSGKNQVTSWSSLLSVPVDQLMKEAIKWSADVKSFDVRPAPKFAVADTNEYLSYLSKERLGASVALFQGSPYLSALLGLQCIAQASAEMAPGFILVGLEAKDFQEPSDLDGAIVTSARITRHGTLVHRPLDRIRIDIEVHDASGTMLCRGAVYKESEVPVHPTSIGTTTPYQGVEFVVPATERMLGSFERLNPFPSVSIIDTSKVETDSERDAALERVATFLRNMPKRNSDTRGGSLLFLRASTHSESDSLKEWVKVLRDVGEHLDGIVLPIGTTTREIHNLDSAIRDLEEQMEWYPGRLKLELCIGPETTIAEIESLVRSSSRVAILAFCRGDLTISQGSSQWSHSKLTQMIAAFGIDVVDSTTSPEDDGRRVAIDTIHACMQGVSRKTVLNPIQLNAVLNPKLYLSDTELEQANIHPEWIRKVLSNHPEHSAIWPESPLTKGSAGI